MHVWLIEDHEMYVFITKMYHYHVHYVCIELHYTGDERQDMTTE